MPVYLFWGDDEFRLQNAIKILEDRVLVPTWKSFNYDKVEGAGSAGVEALIQGLNLAMTVPFGDATIPTHTGLFAARQMLEFFYFLQ